MNEFQIIILQNIPVNRNMFPTPSATSSTDNIEIDFE